MSYEPRALDHNVVIDTIHRAIGEDGRVDSIAETAGARRRAHFSRGGSPKMWRGSPATFTDKRKEAGRRACRGSAEQNLNRV